MDRNRRLLKVIANQIADDAGLRRGFPGLRDFLIDVLNDADSASEIAAKTLHHFCIEEGRYNSNEIGVGLAIRFLNETFGRPQGDGFSRSLKDLKLILNRGASVADLVAWIELWYTK